MFRLIKRIEITSWIVAIAIFVLNFGFRAINTNAQASEPMVAQKRTTETTAQSTTGSGRVPVEIHVEFQKARLDPAQANLLRSWDDVVADDPTLAHRIARQPALLKDQSFLNQHAALRDFVTSHPDFPDQFAQNPGNFVVPR